MQKAQKRIYIGICCGVSFILLLLSIVNCSFKLTFPSTGQALASILVIIGICCVISVSFIKGVKFTIFLFIPYLTVFFLLEFGARFWIANFSDHTTRVQYIAQFDSPRDLGVETVYVPHHYTLYNLRPNYSNPDGTKHNRLGLRDHRDLTTKENVIRIVFIGGSTTYTIGIRDNSKIFSYGLEQRLNEYYKDRLDNWSIEVINAGMGGATSAENLLRLIFFVSEIKPDFVVIQHGLNDVFPRIYGEIQSDFSNYRKSWERPDGACSSEQIQTPIASSGICSEHLPLTNGLIDYFIQQSAILTAIVKRIGIAVRDQEEERDDDGYGRNSDQPLDIGSLVIRLDVERDDDGLKKNDTTYFERNTRYMIAICRAMGSQVLLATEPVWSKKSPKGARLLAMPEHNALLARIAEEENVYFYDFAGDMIKDEIHIPDGRHVSQAGSDLKRDLFFAYFVEQNIIPQLQTEILTAGY